MQACGVHAANSPRHRFALWSYGTSPIGSLAQCRLDEPLGPAIRLQPIRPGELVLHAQILSGSSTLRGPKGCTAICQQALEANVQPRVVRYRVCAGTDGFMLLLDRVYGRESDAYMVIYD